MKVLTAKELNDIADEVVLYEWNKDEMSTDSFGRRLFNSHQRLRFLLSALWRCKHGECWLSDEVAAEIAEVVEEV